MKLWQIRKERKACERFEHHIEGLRLALARQQEPRFYLGLRVELLEELVEQTGGTTLTESYRAQLAFLKQMVALRPSVLLAKCGARS